jgi:hypothetical protein
VLWFFEWCEATWLGTTVRDSLWAFPVLESFHLLGLSLLGGSLLIVDLRMLARLTRQPIGRSGSGPWLRRALVVMLLTGFPLPV